MHRCIDGAGGWHKQLTAKTTSSEIIILTLIYDIFNMKTSYYIGYCATCSVGCRRILSRRLVTRDNKAEAMRFACSVCKVRECCCCPCSNSADRSSPRNTDRRHMLCDIEHRTYINRDQKICFSSFVF